MDVSVKRPETGSAASTRLWAWKLSRVFDGHRAAIGPPLDLRSVAKKRFPFAGRPGHGKRPRMRLHPRSAFSRQPLGSHESAGRFTGSPDAGPPARRVWVVLPRGARVE